MLLRRLEEKVARAVRERLAGRELLVDERARFYGVESRGALQLRGNGCLAATPGELLFVQWVPRRELSIARGQVLAVETAPSHLGKTRFRPLLRVRFMDSSGEHDAVAWEVRDLDAWLAALAAWGPGSDPV
jgi:hypothetical protein